MYGVASNHNLTHCLLLHSLVAFTFNLSVFAVGYLLCSVFEGTMFFIYRIKEVCFGASIGISKVDETYA